MRSAWRYILVGACLLTGLVACQSGERYAMMKAGKKYGVVQGNFRNVWYSLEQRGRSYAAGGFYENAEADFKAAIARRRDDKAWARTYGMHFVPYFPHRELGIVYLKTNRPELALAELDLSLKTASSAKGHYFRDEARRVVLAKTDTAAPTLEILSPKMDTRTRQFHIAVTLTARDDQFVRYLYLGKRRLLVDAAQAEMKRTLDVPLQPGRNNIEITAEDIVGKRTSKTLTVVLDTTGPVVAFGKQGDAQAGHVEDESGVASLLWNDAALPFETNTGAFTLPDASGVLLAKDSVGNTTRVVVPDAGKMNTATIELPRGFARLDGAHPKTPNALLSLGLSRPLATSPATAKTQAIVTPIEISLPGLDKSLQVFQQEFIMDIQVRALAAVRSLHVAKTAIPIRSARRVYVSQRLQLALGSQTIAVEAADAQGHSARQEAVLERLNQGPLAWRERLKLAILPFQSTRATDRAALCEELLRGAVQEQRRFWQVERSAQGLDALKTLQKRDRQAFSETRAALKTGALWGADLLVLGYVIPGAEGLEILSRIVSVETGEILASPQVYADATDSASLRQAMQDLALKMAQALPLVDGTVSKVETAAVWLDRGEHARLRAGSDILFYRTAETDAAAPQDVAKGVVERVYERRARAEVANKSQALRVGDRFVTR